MIKDKNGILIIIALLVSIVIIGGASFYFIFISNRFTIPLVPVLHSCKVQEQRIKKLIEKANYCKVDEDCVVESFNCPFGCGSYINRNANIDSIKSEVNSYQERCGICMYMCVRPFNPVCVNNKCVETQAFCQSDKVYTDQWECRCQKETERFVWVPRGEEQVNLICRTISPCKGDSLYEKQALSYDYEVYSYDNYVKVTGSISEASNQPAQEKTINLYAGRNLYLPTKDGWATVELEKIENNIAYFLFTYMAISPDCKASNQCYSCSFTTKQTSVKGFEEIRLEVRAPFSFASLIIDRQGNVDYEAEQDFDPSGASTSLKQKDSNKISNDQYNELVRLILNNNFFSFKDKYVQKNLMDATAYTINIKSGDKTKSVSCYGPCPKEIIEIREKIKSLWGKEILEVGI